MSSESTAGNHRALFDIGEQRDLAPLLVGKRLRAAAQQDVGLDADAAQFLDRMLRGLGLDFPGTADDGHQRQVHVQHLIAAEFHAHLANRLEKRQRFDVADRAADFHHAHVRIAGAHADPVLDLIGDVRNYLNGRAQIVAATLLGDDPLVNSPGREIAVAPGGRAHEALVVAEIEVGLGAVGGDEHLAVLERAHGAGIHVDVGIQLHHADLEPAGLENGSQGCRRDALAQRGNHAAGDENESSHDESPPIKVSSRAQTSRGYKRSQREQWEFDGNSD